MGSVFRTRTHHMLPYIGLEIRGSLIGGQILALQAGTAVNAFVPVLTFHRHSQEGIPAVFRQPHHATLEDPGGPLAVMGLHIVALGISNIQGLVIPQHPEVIDPVHGFRQAEVAHGAVHRINRPQQLSLGFIDGVLAEPGHRNRHISLPNIHILQGSGGPGRQISGNLAIDCDQLSRHFPGGHIRRKEHDLHRVHFHFSAQVYPQAAAVDPQILIAVASALSIEESILPAVKHGGCLATPQLISPLAEEGIPGRLDFRNGGLAGTPQGPAFQTVIGNGKNGSFIQEFTVGRILLHAGGTAGNIAANASIVAKNNARLEFEELRTVDTVDEMGESVKVVVSRLAEVRFVDVNTGIVLSNHNVPYGSKLYASDGEVVEKGKLIAKWDPFNAVIITEAAGKIEFEAMVENVTYKADVDDATGLREIIIIESKDRTKVPSAHITTEEGNLIRTYNFPVGGHVVVENGQTVKAGDILVKIPRAVGKAGDITGGLPRVTELFEARNPSNPAVVSEIDGEITMGKIKRGNREIVVTSKTGEVKKYLVNLSKQILVQENDYVRAGTPLSDGAITPADILAIKGPTAVQEYIVNEVQDVYRLQGVKINDKHFEIIVRQMMRKVEIVEPGDTRFLEQQVVDKQEFMEENDRIWGKKVVVDAGDSQNLQPGQIVTARKLRDENSMLKRRDLKPVEVRDAIAATSTQILQGITRAALGTSSFMSAASFQETTKVLNEAAINGKVDRLEGMKENVICGHLIPAGTGQREFEKVIVGSKEEYDRILANRKNVVDFSDVE